MDKRTKLIVGSVGAAVVIAAGAGIGLASGADDGDHALRGATYDRATQAALDHVGEGTVTETESGDGQAAYEVEIRKTDGTQVDVELDANFKVINAAGDDDGRGDEGANESEGPNDD